MESEDVDPLLFDHHQSMESGGRKQYKYRYYTLPGLRYSTAIRAIVFVDVIFSLALWLTGGHDDYFVDNIIHFHMTQSTFDLAVMATVKVIVLFVIYAKLETVSLAQVQDPHCRELGRKKSTLHAVLIIFSVIFLAYPTVKGGLVLNGILNDDAYVAMHLTYNILTISAVAFGVVELVAALLSLRAMRRLKAQRILHCLNDKFEEVDEEGKVKKGKVDLARLVSLAKPESALLLCGCAALLVSTASQTAAPLFFGKVIDSAQKSMDALNHTIVLLLLIYLGGAVASMIRAYLFTLAGQRLVARLRINLFHSIIQQEVAFFDTNRTGELTNRLASDTQVLQNAVTVNVSMLARYLLQIVGSLAFMFGLNASLTGVLLAVVPVISLGAVQYGKFVKDLRQKFQDRLAEASTTAEESISSVRTVRSFAGEPKAEREYGKSIDQSYQVGKKLAIATGVFDGAIGMVAYGAIALQLWYGGKLVFDGVITPGILTSFLLYTLNVAFAFALLSSIYGDFMQAVGASIRIFELLDRQPLVPNQGGLELMDFSGDMEFEDVCFTYPSRPDSKVIKSISFTVRRGEMVALVGPSGGGKSTIVSLIERFYDPDSGTIKLGGTDLKLLNARWFRVQMAMVGQEPTLFACSIKDNIAYGKDATDQEVEEVARQANAHEFIASFEEKYETLVGERGVRLSGGQKQRVAIARALIMNPDILLLDEATSALDAESEHLVQEAIDRAMVNRTVIVIAHRLSTVRNAHKVIVIDKGQIAEQGSHEQLLAKDGVYKRLVLRQLTAGLDANHRPEAERNDLESDDDMLIAS